MEEALPASTVLAPGAMLGAYRLVGARSRGAMGLVYEACVAGEVGEAAGATAGRRVAIKVLRQGALRFAHTLTRERDALLALSHPNVVRYVDHGETSDGVPYLVTEWLEGEDLEARLTRGKLDVAAAVEHAVAVARALGAAHARGIVHRDVKPANIHLGRDGVTKLLDFGVAHVRGAQHAAVAVGTALYMAPEQVRATGKVDARADVYALGCVLFECLTGRPPFSGDRATVVLAKAIFEPAPRLSSAGLTVSSHLEALMARLLSKRAEERPATGDEVASLLAACPLTADAAVGTPSAAVANEIDEQRVRCVALVSLPASAGDAMTLADGEAAPLVAHIGALAVEYRVLVDALVDGTLLVTSRDLEPVDQAARIAAFASALTGTLPSAAVALATGMLGGATSSAVERAEGLLRRAPPGQVLTCPATTRVLEEGTTALVGREDLVRELALVTRAPASPRAAFVLGEPALGKTCIMHEVARRVATAGRTVVLVRGELHRGDSPFAPFTAWLRELLGLTGGEGDAARVRAEVLRRRGTEHDAAALLRVVAGPGAAAIAIGQSNEHVERVLGPFLVDALREDDAVLLVDDAQWLDAASVRLLGAMLLGSGEAQVPALVFGRPSAAALFPSLAGAADTTRTLGPLGPSAARELALATCPGLDDDRLQALLERAEGHPFVVRELARALHEGLQSVPETVLGLVQARLAGLSDEARRAARVAALLGTPFTRVGVARLAGEAAGRGLESLVAARVVVAAGPGRFAFASPLLRDAAYELCPVEDRPHAHGQAARWFETQPDPDPAVVAWHDERGDDPSRAAASHAEAARRALAVGELELALSHARRGIACGPSGDVLGALRAREAEALLWTGHYGAANARAVEAAALLAAGSVEWMTAMLTHAQASGRLADGAGLMALAAPLYAARPVNRAAQGRQLHALAQLAWWLYTLGYVAEATPIFHDILGRASVLTLSLDEQAVIHRLRANRAEHAGEWSVMIAEHEHTAELSMRLGERREALIAHLNIGGALTEVGLTARAIGRLDEVVADVSGRVEYAYIMAYARYLRGRALRRAQRSDEAEVELTTALAGGGDDLRVRAQAHAELAMLALDRGDLDEAKERAELAVELAATVPTSLAHAFALRAEVCAREEDVVAARVAADRALAITRADFPIGDDPSYVWRVALDLAAASAREDLAALAREAFEQLTIRADRAGEGVRSSFLALPDNAYIMAHARRAGVEGATSSESA